MILEKIYKEAIRKKKEEIIQKFYEGQDKIAKDKMPVYIIKFQEKLKSKYEELFSQNIDINTEYHFVESFLYSMPGKEDSYKSFDDDFIETKDQIVRKYEDHEFKPKVDVFFAQGDEVILRKLGDIKAYDELRWNFEQELKDIKKKEGPSTTQEDTDLMNVSHKSALLEGYTTTIDQPHIERKVNEKVFTSIRQIADFFHCSLPTAQKIKNAIPKSHYVQSGRTFAIRESVLSKNFGGNKNNS